MASSYKAFISYSHADESWAKWLQHSVERYRIPKRLTDNAAAPLPRRLYPVFRDRSELSSSSDLGASLKESLELSEFLIVICSPSAAKSKWLNEEVQYFQALGRSDRILCFMVDGEPDTESQSCAFPPALVQADTEGGAIEHLAADPRLDGKRNALLKIIGGMLGVGIDDLKQRDAQRRVRVFAGIAAGSAIVAVAMLVLSFYAVSAQKEAELRRGQAEELIGFMLGDLRGKLQPIGRLDILDSVGAEAMDYFAVLDENATPQDLLSRGMALRQIGEVRFSQGQLEDALQSFTESRTVLQRLFEDDESVNDYLFELGQSEFWVGYVHYERAELKEATAAMDNYLAISLQLLNRDPDNDDYLSELVYAYSNLGSVARAQGDLESAIEHFSESVTINERQLLESPQNASIQQDLAGGYSWIGSARLDQGDLAAAEQAYTTSLQQWQKLAAAHDNARFVERTAYAELLLATCLLYRGEGARAVELNRSGYASFVDLIEHDRDNDRWLRGRANGARNLAESLHFQSHATEARQLMGGSLNDFRRLTITDPSNVDIQSQYGLTLAHDAWFRMAAGELSTALEPAGEAFNVMSTLLDRDDVSQTTVEHASLVYGVYADVLDAVDRHEEADKIRDEFFSRIDSQPQLSLIAAARVIPMARQLGKQDYADALVERLEIAGFRHPGYGVPTYSRQSGQ